MGSSSVMRGSLHLCADGGIFPLLALHEARSEVEEWKSGQEDTPQAEGTAG